MKEEKLLKTYLKLIKKIGTDYKYLILSLICVAIESAITAGFAWIMKPLLDKGFIKHDTHFIKALPIIFIFAFLIKSFSGFGSDYTIALVGRNIVMKLRQEMFDRMLYLRTTFFDQNTSGQLLSKLLYNVEQVTKASTDSIITLVRESTLLIGLIVVIVINSIKLSLILAAFVPLIVIFSKYYSSRMRRTSRKIQDSMGTITHAMKEAIDSQKTIKIFSSEKYEQNKFQRLSKNNRSKEIKLMVSSSMSTYISQVITGFMLAAVIYIATSSSNIISAGAFISIITAMLAIIKPMRSISGVNAVMQKAITASESIFKFLEEPMEDNFGKIKLTTCRGKIEIKNLSFKHAGSSFNILDGLNLSIKPGEKIVIMGKSGCGKSTLVNILMRFYDQYSGLIELDDINVKDIELKNYRSHFSLVTQNINLFNDTIANNIAYGHSHLFSKKEIIAAANNALATEFIEQLPEKFDTIIGENGYMLSGGQRQRISIARAILKDPAIMIFDEATSALDQKLEDEFIENLNKSLLTSSKGKTVIVITHRLTLSSVADKVIHL